MDEAWDSDASYENQFDIDEADAALIEKFMTSEPKKQVNLADLIMTKISEADAGSSSDSPHQLQQHQQNSNADSSKPRGAAASASREQRPRLDPRVLEVYSKVGLLLSRYRSGKLPKAFKIIPSFPNWEEILYLTNPAAWYVEL
jgi:essential nuclear protein 1